jgi:hypothetical protein
MSGTGDMYNLEGPLVDRSGPSSVAFIFVADCGENSIAVARAGCGPMRP